MRKTWLVALALLSALIVSPACGPTVDLSTALEVTDVLDGYYDAGLKGGWNYLVPSISFRLHNKSNQKIGPVQVTVAYWQDGADGEWDSIVAQGVRAEGLAPGASTESLLARAPNVGFRLEGPRQTLFGHSMFKDVTARVFASQAGKIHKLGEFKIERTIIPHVD